MATLFLNDPDLRVEMLRRPDGAELIVTGDPERVDEITAEITAEIAAAEGVARA
jgi:hypothetical protein